MLEFDCNIRIRMKLNVLLLVLIGMLAVFVMSTKATAYSLGMWSSVPRLLRHVVRLLLLVVWEYAA